MSNKQNAKKVPFVLLIVSLFMLTVFPATVANAPRNKPKPTAGPCDTVTDANIVKAVRDAFMADHAFDEQRTHMGVDSTRRKVTLYGFVADNALKTKARKLVKAIECVKSVKNKLCIKPCASCGPGQKPCCGGCIDKTLVCNCIG